MALGEIGGNDYNFAFNKGVPRETVRAFVPAVVDKLAAAVEELIGMGARAFVVPGNLPFGCAPLYLNRFRGAAASEYDARTGCLAWFNKFAEYHNRVLTARLDDLRRLHPDVTIVYADWYGAMTSIFQAPGKLGECVRTRQLSLSLSPYFGIVSCLVLCAATATLHPSAFLLSVGLCGDICIHVTNERGEYCTKLSSYVWPDKQHPPLPCRGPPNSYLR